MTTSKGGLCPAEIAASLKPDARSWLLKACNELGASGDDTAGTTPYIKGLVTVVAGRCFATDVGRAVAAELEAGA